MISIRFQGKPPFNITGIQVYALMPKKLKQNISRTNTKDILFITKDWNAKVGSQEIPGTTGNWNTN